MLPPSIHHFKGLGMRNLRYEIRICQKIHNKASQDVHLKFVRNFMNKTLLPERSKQFLC